jgi:hypothetical protein
VKPRQPTGYARPVWCQFRQTECLEDGRVALVMDIAPSHVWKGQMLDKEEVNGYDLHEVAAGDVYL